uniref:Plastid-encoded RNA polymerase subunit alpha n=1 Tax=Pseudochlorodesmis sp. HV01306c TaxID=2358490 RepID=A0A386AYE7_9CHLO|nr:RNA polymerase a-subunit [Pseudochlorodesmis sp. HV01306c]
MIGEKKFYCISSRLENSGQLYGCFKIGPFYGHQSLTFANALRRTLLADKSKCILDAIQINGVEHEFSNLVGVRESIIDIILNFEKILFQIQKPITKPLTATIDFCGPGIVRAQHINLPSNLKCVIPSQYIATIEIDGQLKVKLFFSPNWDKLHSLISTDLVPKIEKSVEKQIQQKKFNNLMSSKKSITNIANQARTNKTTFSILREIWNNKFIQKKTFLVQKIVKIKKFFFVKRLLIPEKNKLLENKINFQALGTIKKPKEIKFFFPETKKENVLFLNNSQNQTTRPCTIQRVHYTLQTNSGINVYKNIKQLNYKKPSKPPENSMPENTIEKQKKLLKKNLTTNLEEFVLFEVWTDGSLHPQIAILHALNELLLEIFPYRLHIIKNEKINYKKLHSDWYSSNSSKNSKKRTNSSLKTKNKFFEKFLNLEISNFHFDLETYLFLKKKKINRIVDFLNFLQNSSKMEKNIDITWNKNWKNIYNSNLFRAGIATIDNLNITPQIKMTLSKFQKFIELTKEY